MESDSWHSRLQQHGTVRRLLIAAAGLLTLAVGVAVSVAATSAAASPSATTSTTTSTVTSPTGCPPNKSVKTAPIAEVKPPARLQINAFDVLSGPIDLNTSSFTLKVQIGSTCSVPVKGASVYVTAVPYNQFSIPAEELTGDDGSAILVFHRDANFPASDQQQQLTLFIRATKPGEDPLAGISTRRLVGIPFG